MTTRRLITSALPYANGPAHLGHLVEHVLSDVYVRYLRAIGEEVTWICAADAHGTPIEVNAAKAGMAPEAFAEKYRQDQDRTFKAFGIAPRHLLHDPLRGEPALGLPDLRRAQGEGAHLQEVGGAALLRDTTSASCPTGSSRGPARSAPPPTSTATSASRAAPPTTRAS